MLFYSEEFIKSVDIRKYLNEDFIKQGLESRIKNYYDPNFMVDYKEIVGITAIDHYMCRIIDKGMSIDNNLEIYLSEILKHLKEHPFLFYSLPISKIHPDKLRRYISNVDEIRLVLKEKGNEVYKLYLKFEDNPRSLNKEERDKLIEYFYYNVETSRGGVKAAQDKFIRFLLNNADQLGCLAISLIIKYFGYKKCQEEGLSDTQILISDTSLHYENANGISQGKIVVISKNKIRAATFQNNKLEKNNRDTEALVDGLFYLLTLFHELRHQKQNYDCENCVISDISYYHAAYRIINLINEEDYNENYAFSEIEKDANYYGWIEVEKVIKNYLTNMDLSEAIRNIQKYKYNELIEHLCGGRKKGTEREVSKYALCKYLDNAIKQKPSIIHNKYRQLLLFYEDFGDPKKTMDLLRMPFNSDFEEFYFEQVIYRSSHCVDVKNTMDKLEKEEKKEVIEKISKIISYINLKLLTIKNYKKSDYSIPLIDRNEDFLIGENVKYYKNAARKLVNFIQNIILKSPEVLMFRANGSNIISEINKGLRYINANDVCNVYENENIPLISIFGGVKHGRRR